MGEQPVAIVTGATGGIGSAVAKSLSREGYHVGLTARGWDALSALNQELITIHAETSMISAPQAHCYSGDIQDLYHIQWILKKFLNHWGRIDLLVTCHGAAPCIKPSEEVTAEDWTRIQETDVLGTFRVCQAVGKVMLQQRSGCIVNLSSIHAFASYPHRAIYASAKAGIVAFSRVLAIEWADRGVRVNCIAPGQVEGKRTSRIAACDVSGPGAYFRDPIVQENTIELMRQRIPNRQLVQPEDVAETVLWLAKTPSINGQTIILDHGLLASSFYEPYLEQSHADR